MHWDQDNSRISKKAWNVRYTNKAPDMQSGPFVGSQQSQHRGLDSYKQDT